MADLPSADHIKSADWEIYDESRNTDDELIWLSSDEESPTLTQTAASLETLPLDASGTEAIISECSAEDPSLIPVSAHWPPIDIGVRLLPNGSAGDGSAGMLFGSILPRHKTFGQFNVTRRLFRVAALVSVLLIGSALPSILSHLRPTRVRASAAPAGPSAATQSSGHVMSKPVRVLTVMAGQQETVRDLGIRYVGHFDNDLFEEIRKLNPDLKDPDHLDDGQLIRIPLRATAPVN